MTAARAASAVLLLGLASACATPTGGGFGMRRQSLDAARPGGFETDLATDVIATAGMLIAGVIVDREKGDWDGVSPCGGTRRPATAEDRRAFARLGDADGVCDRAEVPAFDRPVTRLNWAPARRLSDVALLGMIALPYGVSAADTGFNDVPARNFGVDALIITQTLAADLVTTTLLKTLISRARPLTYNSEFDKATRFGGDARLSFPSGHSSLAFAAASTAAIMLLKRYPGRLEARLGAAGAYLGATTVAGLRVLGGKHFFTDVLAGAAIGTFIGLAIPLAHTAAGETDPASVGQNQARTMIPVMSFGGGF